MQIVDPLAHTNELHRNLQLLADGQHHTAARRAVQLGQHDTGDARHLTELARLINSVLPGGSIHHQQHLHVGVRHLAVNDAADLVQFIHQILFVVQPTGGVANNDIRTARLRRRQGVEHHCRRIGSLPVADNIHSGALCPDLQLFNGGGPEGIRCTQYHLLAPGFELRRHLADGGSLAHAVDTDDQNHRRLGGKR